MYGWMCALRAGIRVCCWEKKKKASAAKTGRVVFGDRHASMLVAAVRPDIRCHPVAIHLL